MNKQESMEQRKRRVFGRFHYLKNYLANLNRLLNKEVTENDLMSIVDSDDFLAHENQFSWRMKISQAINFDDKSLLMDILRKNVEGWDKSYIMYIEGGNDCGYIQIPSLNIFNWAFDINDYPYGIIDFTRTDFKDRISLDYDIETKELEIEIYESSLGEI